MVPRVPRRIDSSLIIAALLIAAVVTGAVSVLRLDVTGESGNGLSAEYAYDLKKLAAVDPSLLLYAEAGPAVSTGFRQSRAIALDASGRMYVAGDKAIRVFSHAGDSEKMIDLSGEPRCLTVADDGKIYVGVGGSRGGFRCTGPTRGILGPPGRGSGPDEHRQVQGRCLCGGRRPSNRPAL